MTTHEDDRYRAVQFDPDSAEDTARCEAIFRRTLANLTSDDIGAITMTVTTVSQLLVITGGKAAMRPSHQEFVAPLDNPAHERHGMTVILSKQCILTCELLLRRFTEELRKEFPPYPPNQ